MTRDRARRHLAAGILATGVAGIHLYWGLPRFAVYVTVGTLADPRPFAFVLSGHAIMVAITLVAAGKLRARRTYLPGIALMVIHIVAYTAWHTVLAHGTVGPPTGPGHDHAHLHLWNVLPVVLDHLLASALALVSKLLEVAVIVLLASCYRDVLRT